MEKSKCYQLLLTFTLNLMLVSSVGTMVGPASVIVDSIEECENPSMYSRPLNVTLSKLNRTHSGFSACYELPTTFDSSYMLNITAAKWGDGGWKPNAFDYAGENACNIMMTNIEETWRSIQKAINVKTECPMPGGNYCVDNYPVKLEHMFKSMLYGKFRVDVMMYRNLEPLFCIRYFTQSVKYKVI